MYLTNWAVLDGIEALKLCGCTIDGVATDIFRRALATLRTGVRKNAGSWTGTVSAEINGGPAGDGARIKRIERTGRRTGGHGFDRRSDH